MAVNWSVAGSSGGNATNVGVTDDTSTNATMYPLWVTAATGNLPAKVSSTKLKYNPSSNTQSVGNVTFVDYSANSGSGVTLDPANGKSQLITLNNATVTITAPSTPSSGDEKEILLEVKQDNSGGRVLTFSGITWGTNGAVAPAYNTAANASTYYMLRGTNASGWVGFPANQNLGIVDGSTAASGYIGEIISSNIPIGSAISLTTTTAANITSISISPGHWLLSGAVGFIPASTMTVLTGSFSTTSATQATSPNGGGYFTHGASFTSAITQVCPVGAMRMNVTVTTTVYLVATGTFASTCTGYGFISAERIR